LDVVQLDLQKQAAAPPPTQPGSWQPPWQDNARPGLENQVLPAFSLPHFSLLLIAFPDFQLVVASSWLWKPDLESGELETSGAPCCPAGQ
jgi:hypothetical protein